MKNLEEQLNNLPQAKLSMRADYKIRWRIYRLKWQRFFEKYNFGAIFRQRLVWVALFLLMLVISVPTYAYASPNVTEGRFLYPVKRMIEKAELTLPSSPEKKAAIYEKNANRRLAEAKVLSERNDAGAAVVLAKTVEQALADKNNAVLIIDNLSDENKKTVASEKINKIQQEQVEIIKQVAQNVGLEADDQILNSVSRMISAVTDRAEVKKNKRKNNFQDNFGLPRSEENIDVATSSETVENSKEKVKTEHRAKTFEELGAELKNLNDLTKSISNHDIPESGAAKLRLKLEDKTKKTNQAMDAGDLGQVEELINESHSLIKNAKYFIKPEKGEKKNFKKKEEDSDEVENKQLAPMRDIHATSTFQFGKKRNR